ncbi:hypothetical protein RDABS01_013559 [Bienertia sinuspersici]
MVKFESKKTSDGLFLTVKDDNDGEKTLIIPVFTPAIGSFGEAWRVEHNPPNLDCWARRYEQATEHAVPLNSSKGTLQRIGSTSGKSHATFEEWCRFWFRGLEQYSTINTPKAVKNFSEFGDPTSWSNVHEVFVVLDVPEKHRKQTYFTAFLSRWLYAFVLPVKNLGCIGPSVFNLASLLASEQRVSLAIPVLASIYRGLNDLSNSSAPAQRREHFPDHYVYAWIAQYFRSYRMAIHNFVGAAMVAFHGPNAIRTLTSVDAKASIRSGKELNWSSFLIPSRGMHIHSSVTPAFASWWKSIYALFTKSPSPSTSLGMGTSHKRKADNTTREVASKAPATSSNKVKNKAKPSRQSTSRSPRPSSHGLSEDKSANVFQDIFSNTAGDDELNYQANFDIAAELNACNNSFGAIDEDLLAAPSNPVVLYATSTIIARNSEAVHDAPPIPTVAPSFKAQDMISEADRHAVGFLVKQMKTKLLHTPLNNIPVLDPKLKELFSYIASKNIDVTSLREHVEAYVSHARSFHALDSSENVQPSLSSLEERLTDVESRLSDVKELKLLEQKKSELSSALATSEDSLAKHDETVKGLTISHTSLEKDIVTAKESAARRKEAEESFQNARASLESLQWEP